MKTGTTLETERLIIRHWTTSESDIDAFHQLTSNEKVRQFFPTRLSRDEARSKLEALTAGLENKPCDWAAACLRETGEVLGFTGLAPVGYQTHFTPAVEIGWSFLPGAWGKGYATEAARALLRQGFEDMALAEIVSFAVEGNTPSIAVMERIGMVQDVGGSFDHPAVPDSHPHLKRHVLYRAKNPDTDG